jgi:4-hydroxy-tetrahydrodipicolinate synthase
VFAPIVTPLNNDGLDVGATIEHVRRVAAEGPHGIVVGGSGGEFIAMSLDERRTLAEIVSETLEGSLPTIVCVAAFATRDVVALAHHAEATNADALLVTAPYVMRPTKAAVRRHFDALREAVDLPLMLYNTPAATNIDFSLNDLEAFVDAGVFQAIKMSFPEAYRLRDLKQSLGDRAAVYCGHDGSALESMIVGADGWISCVPVCFPARAVRLWDSVQRRDPLESLLKQWRSLLPFVRFLYEPDTKVEGEPHWLETTKRVLELLGHPVGPPRPPLRALPTEYDHRLRENLAELGELQPVWQSATG